jgi:predicted permease
MAAVRQFLLRLLAPFRRGPSEQELAREIDAHLGLLEEQFMAKGMSVADARLAARRAFGGVEQAKERQRDARSFRWIEDAQRDIAYAVRSLRRSPGFTTTAVLTLSIGIAASTTIYSVTERVLLRPLPFRDGGQLVRVNHVDQRGTRSWNYNEFREWQSRSTTLSGIASSAMDPQVLLQVRDGMARLAGGFVSFNYFDVLGAEAALGRAIRASDEQTPDVVVLSDGAWRRLFHADRDVIGSTIEFRSGQMTGRLLTVIGVLPPDFPAIGMPLDFYTPIVPVSGARPPTVGLLARLADGVSLAAAVDEANVIGDGLRPITENSKAPASGRRFQVIPLHDTLAAELRPALRVLLAAVAVLLLIVCANVANLLLARGNARQREIAVRLAIGAGRGRIARQLLAECFVITGAGAVVGVALAAAGLTMLRELATTGAPGIFRLAYGASVIPRASEIAVDFSILTIALGVSVIAGLLFSVLPSIHVSRGPQLQAMGTRGAIGSGSDTRLRSTIVVVQLTAATLLLIFAGLLSRTFVSLLNRDKGYDVSHALGFQLVLPDGYSTERKAATIARLLDSLRSIPGVEAAGFSYSGVLLGVEDMTGTIVPPGRSYEEMRTDVEDKPRTRAISAGFLRSMGIRLIEGRDFRDTDDASAPPVVALDRATARRYFGEVSPVGSYVDWMDRSNTPIRLTIIGVFDNVMQGSVTEPAKPQFYVDYRQMIGFGRQLGLRPETIEQLAFGFQAFSIRTAGDPAAIIPDVERSIRSTDALAGIDAIMPLDRLLAASLARPRFYAVMLGLFAAVAGFLAAIGIYGVLTYSVVQRTQEIGVRMALGAERRQVLALVLRRGLLLAAVGIAIGVAGAMAGATYLQSLLFGIDPRDPATFVGVAAAFATVAMIASYLPARRATKVDPMVALRVD